MTSLLRSIRQTSADMGNFVVLPTVATTSANAVLQWNEDANKVTGNFTAIAAGTTTGFTTTGTAPFTNGTLGAISTTGTILRDMGVTIVSSGLTFRKVQYVYPGSANTDTNINPNGPGSGLTNGVYASPVTTALTGYLTFYVQLGKNGGTPGLNLARV